MWYHIDANKGGGRNKVGRTHEEVLKEALQDPLVYAEYMDEELVAEFNAKREEIRERRGTEVEKSPIPDLPDTREELRDLLKNQFQVLRQGEIVSEHGGVYHPGGLAVNNIELKCPFCSMEFMAVQRSGCFSQNVSPSTCPNCNFPSNVHNALWDLVKDKNQED